MRLGRLPGGRAGAWAKAVVRQGVSGRREWELDDLIASWTLVDADQDPRQALCHRAHEPSSTAMMPLLPFVVLGISRRMP